MRLRALRRDFSRIGLAPGALALLLDCGIARGPLPATDSESHFLGCTSEAECSGIAGATCAGGWCVDVETGERIGMNALGDGSWDALPPGPSADGFPTDGPWLDGSDPGVDLPRASVDPAPTCIIESPAQAIDNQVALERLQGCETVYGDLDITFDADLRALSSLREVQGTLSIQPGSHRLSSLVGLENLETVSGDLQLHFLRVRSLESLANLQSVGARSGGGLFLVESSGLHDLRGLAKLRDLQKLGIGASIDFASLDGLTLPSRMDSVMLLDLPQLSSLPPISASSLTLEHTGLTDLSAVTRPVDELAVRRNSQLVDVTVSGVDRLIVENNAALVNLRLPAQYAAPTSLQVIGNPSLQSIVGLDNVVWMNTLSVVENPALHTISMSGLQALDTFQVIRNPSLSVIELPLLIQQVEDLLVVSNPSLSMPSIFSITGRPA